MMNAEISDQLSRVQYAFDESQSSVNFGDHLSLYVLEDLTDRPWTRAPREYSGTKLVAAGTIAHDLEAGYNHVWGTGANTDAAPPSSWSVARCKIWATRGPLSLCDFVKHHICEVSPAVMLGDPGVFAWTWAEEVTPSAGPLYVPHLTRDDDGCPFEVLGTRIEPTRESAVAFARKVASHEPIITGSLHVYLLANSLGLSTALYHPMYGDETLTVPVDKLEYRMRDYLLGMDYNQSVAVTGARTEKAWARAENAAEVVELDPSRFENKRQGLKTQLFRLLEEHERTFATNA